MSGVGRQPTRSPARRVLRAACALLLFGSAACVDVVHVTLVPGDCDETVLERVLAAQAQLFRRDDGLTIQRCVPTSGTLESLADMEQLLSQWISFDDLPAHDSWTLRVQGYSTESCTNKATLVCGRITDLELPPPRRPIVVTVDCAPPIGVELPPNIVACREDSP